jgi:hypothetical protein
MVKLGKSLTPKPYRASDGRGIMTGAEITLRISAHHKIEHSTQKPTNTMQSNKLLVLILALMQGSAFGNGWYHRTSSPSSSPISSSATNYTTAKIIFYPGSDSVLGNCTVNFTLTLTSQVSLWFVEAVASEAGSYPPVTNPYTVATLGYFHGSKWGRRLETVEEPTPVAAEPQYAATEEQGQRKLCSKTGVFPDCNCCSGPCGAWCITGPLCTLCGGNRERNLRAESSRMLRWYWGEGSYQGPVAASIQFAAQRWLNQYDLTQCMGYPWRLEVEVLYL